MTIGAASSARLRVMPRLAGLLVVGALAMGTTQEEAFTPLFDGNSLKGWVNITCAPDTFVARDGVIAVSGAPICEIRTERMYENFVLELEYQHLQPLGNAGVFIWADALPARGQPFLRAIEVQVLDGRNSETYTSHGDVFAIHGAVLTPDRPHPKGAMRSLPSEHRAKGPGEWNHYRITARDGTLKLAVNGKEVSGGYDISPRKGYIALESEGAPVLFRNIRIRELPSSASLAPQQVATAYEGHRSLYDGKSLTGWLTPADRATRWKPTDWTLTHQGDASRAPLALLSSATFGNVEVIADWRWSDKAALATQAGDAAHSAKSIPGARITVAPTSGPQVRPPGEWNRVVQRILGNTLTSSINGQPVAERVQQRGLPAMGRVALVPAIQGDDGYVGQDRKIEFANVFVKPLD